MFKNVTLFEEKIAEFYGAPYAVSTDCCTHALELCMRLLQPQYVTCPTHTYISVPLTFKKLNINWDFKYQEWYDYYYIDENIIDAAVLWKSNSYIPKKYMCVSFQYNKHLSLGKGGMILLDNYDHYIQLQKMSYDGRERGIPWGNQNVSTVGYHYYMTPETAMLGLEKLEDCKNNTPKHWSFSNYPYLPCMQVFKM